MAEISAFYLPSGDEQHYLLKLFQVAVPAGEREWRTHHHLQYEMVLVQEGFGRYRTERTEYDIAPGDVFIFACNEVHSITRIAPGGMRLLNIHFEPRFLWDDGQTVRKNAPLFFAHSPSFENRLPPSHPTTEHIRRLLRETETEMQTRPAEYEWMVRLRLAEVFLLLLRELGYAEGMSPSEAHQQHIRAVTDAIAFIHQHLPEPLTLQQIAEQVRISPNYFSMLFRRIHRMTLWDYITACRIELAIQLMSEDEESTMLEIAMRSGFNNTANFNKAFRKCTGMTPTAYKKSRPEEV